MLLYTRTISDSHGNVRLDQNIVPNFRLNPWLKLELGLRHGETTKLFDAYFHYKVELQTKFFWKKIRLIARLSDNVVKYTSPGYKKSNYLWIAESRVPLSKSFMLLAAGGYVFSYQHDNVFDGYPSVNSGTPNNYPTYKLTVRYTFNQKGYAEITYGAYDVFNPYLLTSPFTQAAFEYDFSEKYTLYSYFRYQYDHQIDAPLNDFLGLGVRIHFHSRS
ncbi:hypothetical protein WSM22_34490 [Cytophagales bacterium WSM2-2]|nr:hypothetical protein WSM22_34490 [Cytophagales bacterium WSM2-2]